MNKYVINPKSFIYYNATENEIRELMNILPIHNSIMNSVTYVLYREDVDYCVLVDCGEWETLKPVLERIGKRVKVVLFTHGHYDNIHGLIGLLQMYPDAEVYTTEYGHLEVQSDRKNLSFFLGCPFSVMGYHQKTLIGGEVLHFEGLMDVDVIATHGHSPSCLSYKITISMVSAFHGSKGVLFTGDAYILGINVFTKFPKANKQLAEESRTLLSQMESEGYRIYCGHHDYEDLGK